MSISVYGRIKEKCLDEKTYKESIGRFFDLQNSNLLIQKDGSLIYVDVGVNNELTISFLEDRKGPYNIYDSDIIGGEFEYIQLIIIDIDKKFISNELYREIIDYFVFLKTYVDTEILVTSDAHDEICLINSEGIIWKKDYANEG